MTEQELAEIILCADDFKYWCRKYATVEDKETHQAIPFDLWPSQEHIADMLIAGQWIAALKARRLGFTWLMVAYAVWLVTFHPNRQIAVLNQDKEYAQDFLDRVRFIQDRLPEWMQVARVNAEGKSRDNVTRIDFDQNGHGCWIRSLASTARAARSIAADLVIMDEAAYHKYLKEALQAAEPALETGKGQLVVLSTSNGPSGAFADLFRAASGERSKYQQVFISWRGHPKRDDAWYEGEKAAHVDDPLYMAREYPASPDEAFQSADGRVYPLFTSFGEQGAKFIRKMDVHEDWKKYRAIDFGGVDPFVCLWGAVVPGDGAGLTVDPSCVNLIRELGAYSYADNGQPKDEDNHACDALRYLCITPDDKGITGHLHVYRELYVPNSASKGLTVPDLARRIAELSPNESFKLTVADRSRPDSIALLAQMGIPACGQRQLRGVRGGEIEQGIVRVNALIVGTAKGEATAQIPAEKPRDLRRMAKVSVFG